MTWSCENRASQRCTQVWWTFFFQLAGLMLVEGRAAVSSACRCPRACLVEQRRNLNYVVVSRCGSVPFGPVVPFHPPSGFGSLWYDAGLFLTRISRGSMTLCHVLLVSFPVPFAGTTGNSSSPAHAINTFIWLRGGITVLTQSSSATATTLTPLFAVGQFRSDNLLLFTVRNSCGYKGLPCASANCL